VTAAALKVYEPADYSGPQDVGKLGTIVLCYIPTSSVSNLAAQVGVKNSPLYTGLTGTLAELASHFVGSYPVTTITVAGAGGGLTQSGGGSSDPSDTPAAAASHSRQDVIIGVVTALGGITLIVLVLLIFRALKRRQELSQRRISDVPAEGTAGFRPPNQEFDRDSIGGQRRRSFYFAADSLAGTEGEQQQQHAYHAQADAIHNPFADPAPAAMRQRGAPISTPILRDNTMNW
jgi:hypothetical protein